MNLVQFERDLEVPSWLRGFVVGCNLIAFTRPSCPYVPFLVVKRELEPKLSGFVSYNNGLPFISEEVPPDYRAYFILHELIEFEELDGVQGRCLEALKRELTFVPAEIRGAYAVYRQKFFQALVAYYARPKDGVSEEFCAEIAASLRYLEGL